MTNPPASPSAATPKGRLVGLDGLRGLAVIAVILVHVIIILPADRDVISTPMLVLVQLGRHGLTVFFVLSGFLIFRPFVQAILRDRPRPAIGEYARNRVLRIWPAYLVILAIATIALPWGVVSQRGNCPPVDTGCTDQVVGRLTSPAEILTNLALVQGWYPSTAFTGLGVSWSLVTEIGFYVLVPILGAFGLTVARRHGRVVGALLPGILLLLVGIIGRWGTHLHWINAGHNDDIPFGPTWTAVLNRSVIGQADTFGLGMLAAVAIVSAPAMTDRGVRLLRRSAWTLFLLAPLVLLAFVVSGPTSGEAATEFMAVEAAALITLMLLPDRDRVSDAIVRIFDLTLPTKLGEYSLSWYLWHYPVVLWFQAHATWAHFSSLPTLALALLVVCVPISVLSYLTYNFVEKPAMRWKRAAKVEPAREAG